MSKLAGVAGASQVSRFDIRMTGSDMLQEAHGRVVSLTAHGTSRWQGGRQGHRFNNLSPHAAAFRG
ncbi:hypothetical protein DF146_19165 [Burkholderia cenocepacia]|nr:hypothetical protein DF146_19165 [Burkholderia cenocepacia]